VKRTAEKLWVAGLLLSRPLGGLVKSLLFNPTHESGGLLSFVGFADFKAKHPSRTCPQNVCAIDGICGSVLSFNSLASCGVVRGASESLIWFQEPVR